MLNKKKGFYSGGYLSAPAVELKLRRAKQHLGFPYLGTRLHLWLLNIYPESKEDARSDVLI